MKKHWILYTVLCLILSCSDDKKEAAVPELTLYAAQDITRNSAVLSGSITTGGGVSVTSAVFIYAPTDGSEAEKRATASGLSGKVEAQVEGLQAGKAYRFRLEAGNTISKVASEEQHFTTQANNKPVLGELVLVGKGLVSVTVQCTLQDTGGLPTEVGFRITGQGGSATITIPGEWFANELYSGKMGNLTPQSTYTIYAYAVNELGETRSNEIEFETLNAVYVSTAGTLKDILEGEGRYELSELSVSGQLNGSDFRVIRDILGRDHFGEETPGKLKSLNLYDAVIVEGGLSYTDSYVTQNNVLGTYMFKDCTYLEELILPATLESIERNAFAGCTGLRSLHLPAAVKTFTPSAGCTALTEITVSEQNTTFSSMNGVLFNKSQTELLCYPEGKTDETFAIPASAHTIGEYAFQYAQITSIKIPDSVKTLKDGAFDSSQVASAVISNGVKEIPRSCFQSCANLKTVQIGTAIELLAEYCFEGCPLEHIYVLPDWPPTCRETAFSFDNTPSLTNCVIHALPGCKDYYRLNSGVWGKFIYFRDDASL